MEKKIQLERGARIVEIAKWHARTSSEALAFWQTDKQEGLANGEVKNRLGKFGYNEMVEKPKEPWWKRFLAQFQDFMVLTLLGATLISAFLGEYVDAATILSIVIINAILGFVQEYQAERSMAALQQLAAPTARVIRNGVIQQIPARELVPGDLIVLEAGDKLAADARLLETFSMEVEEAALTGESLPVRKSSEELFNLQEEVPLGDRRNMVYAGTSVTRGRGTAIVCATAMETEVGKIAGMLQDVEREDTPLERRLERLGKWLVWGCLGICLVVVITGVIKGESLLLMCMAGISLAVAAIPEGLPAIVTVALALGVKRMIRRNAIVRKLPAVETLGCTTAICSDKTGTLTQNAMTVRKVFANGQTYEISGTGYDIKGEFSFGGKPVDARTDKCLRQALYVGVMCNNSILKRNNAGITGLWRKKSVDNWSVEGDPTEGALVVLAAKADIWRELEEKKLARVAELPFESERRRMSVIYRDSAGEDTLYVKGAADVVVGLCRYYLSESGERPLTPEMVQQIIQTNDSMAAEALRVLAVAYRRLPREYAYAAGDNAERELIFVGLTGMIDPPREEAIQAISVCRQAGIKTVMITGDHKITAMAVASELRLYKEGVNRALTGAELDAIDDREFGRIVNDVSVYARVTPSHKLRIVRALKQRGHIVAMTGDGVNDAPAIKEADIGIAMGITGTDVTKEASSMVLADDNFATIVAAVEEGRGIYDNIRKFIRYLLGCNIGEVLTMFVASLAGWPLPLLPVQILWVNLVTDGLPAMALGVDTNDPDIMRRAPRDPSESVFSRGLTRKIIGRGIQIGFSTLMVFAAVFYLKEDLPLARTMAFATLVFCQLFHVFDCRSETLTIFQLGVFTNRYLVAAVACSAIMQLAVMYLPFMTSIFNTVPMGLLDWAFVILVSGWTFFMGAMKHVFFRRRAMRTIWNRI